MKINHLFFLLFICKNFSLLKLNFMYFIDFIWHLNEFCSNIGSRNNVHTKQEKLAPHTS